MLPIGTMVKSNRDFVSVPAYSRGMIDEHYDGGVMVAWDLLDRPLPKDWEYTGQWAATPGVPLRDGFSHEEADRYLEVVEKC